MLIGSEAVGTGIDGPSLACDNLVFAVLPWTAANYEQVIGRLNRTAQTAPVVNVTIPVTYAPSYTRVVRGSLQAWRRDRQRLQVIRNKSSIADAVVDGTVPEHLGGHRAVVHEGAAHLAACRRACDDRRRRGGLNLRRRRPGRSAGARPVRSTGPRTG